MNQDRGDGHANLDNSVMDQMPRLKQSHHQPRVGMLPDDFDLDLDREQECAQIGDFE